MYIYIPKIKVRYQSITELLTIKEYWNLIDRELFLSITWEPDFFQSCSFWRMLEDHNNFHFTLIPDKTNDLIFLKCPKNLVFGPFWPFLTSFFSKKSCSVTCNWIWTPNTILSFRKKQMSQFWENLRTDYRTDGQMQGQTLFHRTFLAMSGCLTRETTKEDQA